MSVARVTEIIASSNKSFEDAVERGIQRANKTLKNVRGAWVEGQKVVCDGGKITEYRAILKVSFILEARRAPSWAISRKSRPDGGFEPQHGPGRTPGPFSFMTRRYPWPGSGPSHPRRPTWNRCALQG